MQCAYCGGPVVTTAPQPPPQAQYGQGSYGPGPYGQAPQAYGAPPATPYGPPPGQPVEMMPGQQYGQMQPGQPQAFGQYGPAAPFNPTPIRYKQGIQTWGVLTWIRIVIGVGFVLLWLIFQIAR